MIFGPAVPGDTVETIAQNIRFRGRLTAYRDDAAFIAVDGMPETICVHRSNIAVYERGPYSK